MHDRISVCFYVLVQNGWNPLRGKTSVFCSVAMVTLNGKDLLLFKILTPPSRLLYQLRRPDVWRSSGECTPDIWGSRCWQAQAAGRDCPFDGALPSGELEHVPWVTAGTWLPSWPSGCNSGWPALAHCQPPRLGERGCGPGLHMRDEQPVGRGLWPGRACHLSFAISTWCLSSLKYKYISWRQSY